MEKKDLLEKEKQLFEPFYNENFLYIANSNDCVALGKKIHRKFEKEDLARYAMFFDGGSSSKCERESGSIAKDNAVFLLSGAYALLHANEMDKTIFFISCYVLAAIEISFRYCDDIEGEFKKVFAEELSYYNMVFHLVKNNKFIEEEVEIWSALCAILHGSQYLSKNEVDIVDIVSLRNESNTHLLFKEMARAAQKLFYKSVGSKERVVPSSVIKNLFSSF